MKCAIQAKCWLALCLLATLAGNMTAQAPQLQPREQPEMKLPTLLTAKPIKEDPQDDDLRKLLKARYNEAVAEMDQRYKELLTGRGTLDVMVETAQRLVKSGLELSDGPAERAVLLTQYVELTKDVERIIQARFDEGNLQATQLHQARYQRLDAEIQLLRAKRESDKVKSK